MKVATPRLERWVALALGTLLVLAWWAYRLYGERIVAAVLDGRLPKVLSFAAVPSEFGLRPPNEYLALMRHGLLAASALYVLGLLVWRFAWRQSTWFMTQVRRRAIRRRALPVLVWAGCTWTCLWALTFQAREMPWNVVEEVMTFTAGPLVRHRILFALVANLFRQALPGASFRQCFLLSQLLAIGLMFYAIVKWAELFVERRYAQVAPLLLLAMLVPTFHYYTFYDIGIVLFFTVGLLLLTRGRLIAYLGVFALGTLNHEVTFLLTVVSFAVLLAQRAMTTSRLLALVLAQIGLYVAVRWVLFTCLPVSGAWMSGRVWLNLDLILHHPWPVSQSMLTLLPWWGLAALGLPYAPTVLRRALVLAPLLVCTTLLMGQLNEPRQFDAIMPVVVACILCLMARNQVGSTPVTQPQLMFGEPVRN